MKDVSPATLQMVEDPANKDSKRNDHKLKILLTRLMK
jgi:hypothetical protein